MNTPSRKWTSKSPPPSRRDVLKYAAGALALGLGTPLGALAAGNEDWRLFEKITWYVDGKALHSQEIPHEVAEVLLDAPSRVFAKIHPMRGEDTHPEEDKVVTFSLRRVS